jgi:hypothetical protein
MGGGFNKLLDGSKARRTGLSAPGEKD